MIHVYEKTAFTPEIDLAARSGQGNPIGDWLLSLIRPRIRIEDDTLGHISTVAPWGEPGDLHWVLWVFLGLIILGVVLWAKAVF